MRMSVARRRAGECSVPSRLGIPVAASLVVFLPVVTLLPVAALPHLFLLEWLGGTPMSALATMAAVSALVGWLGWCSLGSVQRWAWAVSCVLGVFVLFQGQRMQVFHGAAGPDWASATAAGNLFLWILVPLLVARWRASQLNMLARCGMAFASVLSAVVCVGQFAAAHLGFAEADDLGPRPIDAYGVYGDAYLVSGLLLSPNYAAAVLVVCWPALLGRGTRESRRVQVLRALGAVSYTHLTLPTIYSV